MTRKTMNVIIGILVAFIVVFFAGSFAYENYIIERSDAQYDRNLEGELDQAAKDNQSGATNDEARN
jgi:uncharacterized membrane protein YgaE (UPF0421/DUF939 family)